MTLPAYYDCRHGIRKWLDLGNFALGDCTVAAWLHLTMVHNVAAASSWKKLLYRLGYRPPHDPFAIEEYTAYLATLNEKPSPTTGVDPASFFAWLKSLGKIKDYAQIDITGPSGEDSLHQAMIDWNGCLLALELTDCAYSNPFNGRPWMIRVGDVPDPNLGHAVALVVYGPLNDGVVTWGEVKNMTREFTKACVYACWVFR